MYKDGTLVYQGSGTLGRVCPYEAELFAIKEALEWMVSNPFRLKGLRINLFTDSKSAELALKSITVKNVIVKSILEKIHLIKQDNMFDISWIKGHSGMAGHDLADSLAKAEADKSNQDLSNHKIRTLNDLKVKIQERSLRIWRKRWSDDGPTYAKKFDLDVNPEKMKYIKKISQKNLGILVQAVSNHGLFGQHLSHWNKDLDSTCQCCLEDEETSYHLWNECPALERERERHHQMVNEIPKEVVLVKYFKLDPITEVLKERSIYLQQRRG